MYIIATTYTTGAASRRHRLASVNYIIQAKSNMIGQTDRIVFRFGSVELR